jgi:hypothetical protein
VLPTAGEKVGTMTIGGVTGTANLISDPTGRWNPKEGREGAGFLLAGNVDAMKTGKHFAAATITLFSSAAVNRRKGAGTSGRTKPAEVPFPAEIPVEPGDRLGLETGPGTGGPNYYPSTYSAPLGNRQCGLSARQKSGRRWGRAANSKSGTAEGIC